MNNSQYFFVKLAVSLVGLSALLNVFLVFQQALLQRELENVNNQLNQSQRQLSQCSLPQIETIIRNLVSDLIVYGQKQPSIYPGVLQKYGVNPLAAASAALPSPKPSSKPKG